MRGGEKLPGSDRSLTEPGEILLLAGDGSLIVQRELEDAAEIDRQKNMVAGGFDTQTPSSGDTSPRSTSPPPGRRTTPEDYDAFDQIFN
jgi:hypothetical protein